MRNSFGMPSPGIQIPGKLAGCRIPPGEGEDRSSHSDPGSRNYSGPGGSCSGTQMIKPLHEQINNLGFRTGSTQTELYQGQKMVRD